MPATQLEQLIDPDVAGAYRPIAQEAHSAAPIPEYMPEPQASHVVESDAPVATDLRPAPQLVHVVDADCPAAIEYVPVLHAVHVAAPVPDW